MTQTLINIGTAANDGTGDTIRGAFANTNNNFTELYNNHTNTVSNIVSVSVASNNWSNTIATAGNNYTVSVGAASNTWANVVATAGNNYTNSFVTIAYNRANNGYDLANAAYNFANTIGDTSNNTVIFNHANAAFDKANSANVLAYEANTKATVLGPYADDSAAQTGGVAVMGLYYTTDGNVRIRLV